MYGFLCAWLNISGYLVMALIKPVSPATPAPTWMLCNHAHWRVYQSLGYRECDKCKVQKPIFNDIKHQR
jgi:hypothetical protein